MTNTFNYFLNKFSLIFFITLLSIYLIFSPSLNLLAYDEKRIIELIIISTSLILTLFNNNYKEIYHFYYLRLHQQIPLIIISFLLILSSLVSPSPNNALLESSLYLGLIFFSFYIARICHFDQPRFQLFFFLTIAIAAFCYLTNFYTAYLASFIENIPLRWPEPFSGFSHVRFFNQFQIWSLTLLPLPVLLFPSLDKRLRVFLIIIAIGWASLLFASGSRGAVGSVLIAMLLTAIFFKKHAKPLLMLNASILLAGFFLYLLLFKFVPTLLENKVTLGWLPVEEITRSSGRDELWRYAIKYIIENPWLGIGPMHYAYYPGLLNAHPHNSILQWACEMGIPSTILVIFLTVSGLTSWIRKFYRLNSSNKYDVSPQLWIALFCTLISGLIYSLISGVIVMPLSQTLMALIIGWMIGLYFKDQLFQEINKKQNVTYKLATGIILVTLIYTVQPHLKPRLFSPSELINLHFPISEPRFWQIGGIPH